MGSPVSPIIANLCMETFEIKSGSGSADVKGYVSGGGWNEILSVKSVKNISTRKELNINHGTNEHVEW